VPARPSLLRALRPCLRWLGDAALLVDPNRHGRHRSRATQLTESDDLRRELAERGTAPGAAVHLGESGSGDLGCLSGTGSLRCRRGESDLVVCCCGASAGRAA